MWELVSRNSELCHWTNPTSLNQLHHFWRGARQLQGHGCTSQSQQDPAHSFGQASFLVEHWLPICHWKAQLFGSNYEARYCTCNSPTRKVLIQPKGTSWEAVLYLILYFKKIWDLGTCFKPDQDKGFKCYCDAEFSGNWNKHLALFNPSTAKSRSGWIVFYAGWPVIWVSKLQTQVALSTTGAQ